MHCSFSTRWSLRWLAALGCAAATMLTVFALPLRAQDPDMPAEQPFGAEEQPFGDVMPAEDEPFDAPEPGFGDEKPKPKPRAAAPRPAADAAAPAVPADPAVEAVLESKPETPFELLRAIRILADLGHPKLAAPFVERLNKEQLDTAAKAALAKKFDSATLMRLAGHPELGPTLGPFVDDVFRSAEDYRRDPARLSEAAAQLVDKDEAVRARAIVALLEGREASVAPLVALLGEAAQTAVHPRAKRVLLQLGDLAIEPLLGVLESPEAALKTQVVEVLGALRAQRAVVALLFPLASPASTPQLRAAAAAAIERTSGRVPDVNEAMRLLEHAAARRLAQTRDDAGDTSGGVEVWHWNAEKKQSVPSLTNETGAAMSDAVRLAGDLYALDPQSPQRRLLYLTALLQAAQLAHGLDKPLPTDEGTPYAVAAAHGAGAIENVLIHAMAEGYLPAATAAAQMLGDIGSRDLLARGGATAGALVRAAHHADRRLRLAAIGAILKLKPNEPFAGSSWVTEGLGFFAGSYGAPRILIAHPLSGDGATLAGLAAALGYEADVATNGRQAFELAVASPDYEMILIHSAIDRPPVDELLHQLRREGRTNLLPVGFMATPGNLERIAEFARRAGGAEAFLQPRTEEEMKLYAGDVLARAGRWHVPNDVRQAQALAAMEWLIDLAESGQRVFDVASLEPAIVRALYVPQLAGRAAELLGHVGTDKTQRALVEMAGSAAQPLAMRKAAVAALARAMRDRGILLTTDEINLQYDLYNDNAGRDPQTHEVLDELLDVIEHKGAPPDES